MKPALSTAELAGSRVLVTGASGFIGSRLLERLEATDAEVHAVSRNVPVGVDGRSRWWRADLSDGHAARELVAEVEPRALLHLGGTAAGAPSPELTMPMLEAHLLSTVNVLEAARQTGCERVVLAGSTLEQAPAYEDGAPGSPYAAAKWAASVWARMFHNLWEVPVVVLRLGMVYGPGQPGTHKLVPHLVGSLARGETPELSNGAAEFDWVYVDDVVDAFMAAATVPGIEGRTIEVGSGELLSVREFAERLRDVVSPGAQLGFGELPSRPVGGHPRPADTSSARRLLDWTSRVPLEQGLRKTADWYRRHATNVTVSLAGYVGMALEYLPAA